MSKCKGCGACENPNPCECCGKCRNCGQFHPRPVPHLGWPYVEPYPYRPALPWWADQITYTTHTTTAASDFDIGSGAEITCDCS